VRYLEILLAALIFVTSLVLGTAIPRIDMVGVEETSSDIVTATSSVSVPSTAGEVSLEAEAIAPSPDAIAQALSPAHDSVSLQ
jgi:hypothetical protein